MSDRTWADTESDHYNRSDNPETILNAIQERENVDVLFKLDSVEQFRVTWCVYVRDRDQSSEE